MAIYKIYPWYKKSDGGSYIIPSWSTGTDAEIVEALQKHYAGEIDLHQAEGWEIGAERTITLSGINDGVDETIVMVLMNKGGKTLNTSINGHTECAFIVGQKDLLSFVKRIDPNNSSMTKWDNCELRTWCNSDYKNSFPSTIVNIFKQHINTTGISANATADSIDYFGIPAEKELGTISTSYPSEYNLLTAFEYYNSTTKRKKKKGDNYYYYWTRSQKYGSSDYIYIGVDGSASSRNPTSNAGLAPFGVI